jgi:cytochrome oxidase assembly protein ShyY1
MAEYTGSQPLLIEQTFGSIPNSPISPLPSHPPSSAHSPLSRNSLTCCGDGGLLDAEQLVEKGMPIGRYPGITIRNAHFQYIVTWYASILRGINIGILLHLLQRECVIFFFDVRGLLMRNGC